MAGPTVPEPSEDVEEFMEKVDEVSRLIEGLKAGTISPDYIDSKMEQKKRKEEERQQAEPQRPAGRGHVAALPAPESSGSTAASSDADVDQHAEVAAEAEAERRERAMQKVKELMASRERKLHARVRYEEYVKTQDKSRFGTDYNKWDIWCPEDEEDDIFNSMAPNTPQFKAMEKDIDERHRQMVERRQLAERCRVAGNEAYATKQYSEALRCYQRGIESERTNMALHANAAMAALKMSCFVQAVEHCDKVLSIADFFHNSRKDALVVKALQRRAEAFRALQQHSRAVEDLASAQELEPGNAEVAKQLARARQEDEEARKQRAIARAVAGKGPKSKAGEEGQAAAASTPAGTVEVAGMTVDLGKLGHVERLASQLAPLEPGTSSSGTVRQAEAGAQGGAEAASTSASQSPALPPRGKGGKGAGSSKAGPDAGAGAEQRGPQDSLTTGSTVAEACAGLRQLLKGDDACCVYYRECGGLAHAAARVAKPPPGQPPSDLAPLLLLLNDAAMNDGNLKQLPGLKVLPAVVSALDGSGDAAAAAAAALLCTSVTNEDVRKEVSRLLGAGEGLGRLLRLLAGAMPAVQGVGLALLANCMVDRPTKQAMTAAWRADAGGTAAPGATFRGLLGAPVPVLAEKAAVLLGNMATDAPLRAEMLASHGPELVTELLELATRGLGPSGSGQKGGAEASEAAALRQAAATALFNLTVDEAGQRAVAEAAGGGLTKLYALATAPPPQLDAALSARAAGIVARAAKTAAGAAVLLGLGAVKGMTKAASQALDSLEATASASASTTASAAGSAAPAAPSSGSGLEREAQAALLDAAIRTLTILTTPDDPALAAALADAGGVATLLRAVRLAKLASPAATTSPAAAASTASGSSSGPQGAGESVLANAALCLAGLARRKEYLPALRQADAVPPLVAVAYEGKGNAASKNAAIALARMAADSAMLEKLRELHGIEIIYQYVKP
ncbi:hypothetical protein HYH03_002326 [Edaphochlamys debaryana]|uniref:Protein unc-45 homolog B n=1 Tax=Edaphochlamys debaryana TaxID=47281 RepID=A0A835YFM9_9CHLO|nr:hypothetical protein HYH03_002326 [Edaphochlamys debaryana]|eukprot:KAG2500046.1 hypothetical protein HYH03_002326 [Edaphochlamys debaryana]